MELALSCDLTVASSCALFGEPEVSIASGIVVLNFCVVQITTSSARILLIDCDGTHAIKSAAEDKNGTFIRFHQHSVLVAERVGVCSMSERRARR